MNQRGFVADKVKPSSEYAIHTLDAEHDGLLQPVTDAIADLALVWAGVVVLDAEDGEGSVAF